MTPSTTNTAAREFSDKFAGDNSRLLESIGALLNLDEAGAFIPHSVGGHARLLLNAAASRLATLTQQQGGEQDAVDGDRIYCEARECENCGHAGINDSHTVNAACLECDWSGPSPQEDQCPACHQKGVMTAACPRCNGRYRLVAEAEIPALRTKQPAASEGGVARALVWVRQWAPFTAPEDREHIAVIEEALAAYDPERMARCGNTSKQAAVEAVPIGWFTDDHLTDRSATTYDKTVADRWVAKGWPITPIYTAPPRHPADEGIDGTR